MRSWLEAEEERPTFLTPFTGFESESCREGADVPFAVPGLPFVEYVFCTAPRVVLLSEGGCNSRGI